MSLLVLLRLCVCVRKREKRCVIVNQKVDVHGVVRCCCGGANKKILCKRQGCEEAK